MKNILLVFCCLSVFTTLAQSKLDLQLVNVNQSTVTSGIIYDRVKSFADLYSFNLFGSNNTTANYSYFEQALSELYRASNKTKLISTSELRNRIMADEEIKNSVNIGIINTPFQTINYNFENPAAGGLNFNGNFYSQIAGKAPFLSSYTFMIAPLKKTAEGSQITYKFRNDLILNNGSRTIKKLVANLGDGVLKTIIDNSILVLPTVTVANTLESHNQKLIFNITFMDDNVLTTYGLIYLFKPIFVPATASNSLAASSTSSNNCDPDPLQEDWFSKFNKLTSDYSFQGLNEQFSYFGQLEARIFYHTYSGGTPNVQNFEKKMLKPIILIDGFDPGDKRKIQDCDCQNDADCVVSNLDENGIFDPQKHKSLKDLMDYQDINNQKQNLILELRIKGFDVIIVNQPTYTFIHPTIPTIQIFNQTITNYIKIDGGADYVERNALALVTLMQRINQKLIQNGSTEKLAIVGPSMGGQISRYALAYMEKKFAETNNNFWKHNTKLWISVDSPHLGANIPMGDQALLNILREDSEDAEKKYTKLLNSIASKELLIELHQPVVTSTDDITSVVNGNYLNGQTISQGMPANSGNPFYQFHYNNQNNNGVPGSNGWPVSNSNFRKIAIVNGSLTGEMNGSNGQKVFKTKAVERVCIHPCTIPWLQCLGFDPSYCFNKILASMETYFLPQTGSTLKIAGFYKFAPGGSYDINTYSPNLNTRGNMDIVPGGTVATQEEFNSAITGAPITSTNNNSFWHMTGENLTYFFINHIGRNFWETETVFPSHSFIPTFSAIGIKQPNQNWANRLDRNLV